MISHLGLIRTFLNQQILVNQTFSLPLWNASHGGENNETCDLSLARHLNLAVKTLLAF